MKKYCLCFVEDIDEKSEIYQFIEQFEKMGVEVHLFSDCVTDNLQPHDILKCVDELKKESSSEFYFITDIMNLGLACYRIYHQIFQEFILFDSTTTNLSIQLVDLYALLMDYPVSERENLYKPLYTNTDSIEVNNGHNVNEFWSDFSTNNNSGKSQVNILKIYEIEGVYLLLEPLYNVEKHIIRFTEESNTEFNDFIIGYYHETNIIKTIHEELNKFYNENDKNLQVILENLSKLTDIYNSVGIYEKNAMVCYIQYYIEASVDSVLVKIMFLSWLIDVVNCKEALDKLILLAIHNEQLTTYNRFYLWNQIKRTRLINSAISTKENRELYLNLYKLVYDQYYNKLKDNIVKIPREDRDSDFILIMSYSFLGERHAPTRTTLERIYTIGKLLNKRVMLINTRETLTNLGIILMNDNKMRNLIEEYNEKETYEYKGFTFPFFQPNVEMPCYSMVTDIIEFVKQTKPYFILSIGGGSIVSDLCSNIVPVLSMSVVFSGLPITMSKLSILGRKVREQEWPSLIEAGYDRDSIIESRFTFDLIEKQSIITRQQLQLPEDKFLLLVVGIRLDSDITDEFISYMKKTFIYGTHVVFAGIFNQYDEYCERHDQLREHSTYIGYCEDMLALNSICDLYVNPKRFGGGFSIIEAFHEGKPGVTINTGDVAISGGSDFCVEDYDEMVEIIIRYIKDKDFYNNMSKKAIERAKIMTDSKSAMEELIDRAVSSKYFF